MLMSEGVQDEPPPWRPGRYAIRLERWVDPNDAGPTTILLEHPTAPFARPLATGDEPALQAAALAYLRAADAYLRAADEVVGLGLPDTWLDSLETPEQGHFSWVPVERGKDAGPIGSFWLEHAEEGERRDRTLVLLASQHFKGGFLGSEFGIRVAVEVHGPEQGPVEVRIRGMSASLPFGPYRMEPARGDWEVGNLRTLDLDAFRERVAARVSPALRLRARSVFFRGVRLGRTFAGTWQVELRGRGLDGVEEDEPASSVPYEFIAIGTLSNGGDLTISSLKRIPLTACAQPGEAGVFKRDPPSWGGPESLRRRRPSRSDDDLDDFRQFERIAPNANANLEVAGRRRVLRTLYVLEDQQTAGTKRVQLPGNGPAIRSNDLSAVSAYRNLGQLFDRFALYGIPPASYFKIASLPLKGVYRSGIRPGPGKDGQTINASVQPEGWPPGFPGPTNAGDHPRLEVHLALGDLSRRAREPWNRVDRSPAEPLGIASDQRWLWHEIGHVLLMASVGELEFRFAHSAGDALAAIVADPTSEISAAWRGATFPWVFVPRRHDRCVHHGWSWSGSLRRAHASVPNADRVRRKGYWSEQILSSSLFRAYRCLGGDTVDASTGVPDGTARELASDYVVYLIMRGIELLGDARFAPANRPEQFVEALIQADRGPPFTFPNRIGGCARKVIRWAFEAQGMYPADPNVISNVPGRHDPVDIYIEDRRPTAETSQRCSVEHGPGAYVPVSLDWGRYTDPRAGIPRWFAQETAVENQGGQVFVRVGNRGRADAAGVTVRVWWHAWPAGNPPPRWDATQWTEAVPQPPPQDIPRREIRQFGGFPLGLGAGRHLVLAHATCADDRANTDPATLFPCSLQATPLVDLVANDNNLGLVVIPPL
jgi:hypothetical protein